MIDTRVFLRRRFNEASSPRRYKKRDLIELVRGTGCPTPQMEAETSAIHVIRVHRKSLKTTDRGYLDLWWRTRGYEIV